MIRIYKTTKVPKFISGGFSWDSQQKVFKYTYRETGSAFAENFVVTNGFKFKRIINELEEGVFRQEYQKQKTAIDYEVIQVDDIRDLVLFLAPSEILRPDFLRFVHMDIATRLFRALIIYFENFLKVAEFAQRRQIEMMGDEKAFQTYESLLLRQEFGHRLTQYRIAIAREYRHLILCLGDLGEYYHTIMINKIPRNAFDRMFHESIIAVATQIVWIAMHRREYDTIDWEMSRLFRTEHFFLRPFTQKNIYTKVDLQMLYGKNYKRINFRRQISPLIQEIKNISKENLPILNFHLTKYEGTDFRIKQLEMEFSAAERDLILLDVVQGILGHHKKLYNTILQRDDEFVRDYRYKDIYDPYHIIRNPELEVPLLNEQKIRQARRKDEILFHMRQKVKEIVDPDRVEKWMQRDKIIHYFATTGVLTSCYTKAIKELARTGYGAKPEEIMAKFMDEKAKEALEKQKEQKKCSVFRSKINKYGLSKLK